MFHIKPILEQYRVRTGRLGSRTGDPYGLFMLPGGFTSPLSRRIQVIATDGRIRETLTEATREALIGAPADIKATIERSEEWEHVSGTVVHYVRGSKLPRHHTPTWYEMVGLRDLFWSPEDLVVQFHPPASDYVNNHPNVLHLWRPIGVNIPTPPISFV